MNTLNIESRKMALDPTLSPSVFGGAAQRPDLVAGIEWNPACNELRQQDVDCYFRD
jgi:hypothetical protein